MLLYEYPFTERIRTLLRLEDLFERYQHFCWHEHALDHHVALTLLFDIAEVASRADLKSDLMQELERQRQQLMSYRGNPHVETERLEPVISEVETLQASLNALPGKIGQHLRENEWLASIRGRILIPGGSCEFDLPSYHAWLSSEKSLRQNQLNVWAAPFYPLRDSLALVLKLLRETGQTVRALAPAGYMQQPLGGKQFQLLRLQVDPNLHAVPEISANKHMLMIRFMHFEPNAADERPKQCEIDVPFEMALCSA